MKKLVLICMTLASGLFVSAKEYHVSHKTGADTHSGTAEKPFKTISKAAEVAFAGDVITVHEGVYREWINPPRGGNSNTNRITYRAAAGEKAHIKGSEVVTGWESVGGGVWKITLSDSFFGSFNPFRELVGGDWYDNLGWDHHLGDVYLNGKSLYEVASHEGVANPQPRKEAQDPDGERYAWFVEKGNGAVTIWANFQKENPNKALTEVSARNTCFYPTLRGVNYITLSGFEISQAASQWAAPTVEQIGMVATHWNKGWVLENNILHDARCSAITLGKSSNPEITDNPEKDGSLRYIEVTFATLRDGWNKENIGSHLVRGNEIYLCEQAAICGSQGAAFSEVSHNDIHDIWYKRQFSGAELSGIKFHGGIDTKIHNNRIGNCIRGVWMDWMAQGSSVYNNLIYGSIWDDIFYEVNHGPYMIYNNILLSDIGMLLLSDGGLVAHNLVTGKVEVIDDRGRYTPYHLPHSTEIKGFSLIFSGDNREMNNIYVGPSPATIVEGVRQYGTLHYDKATQPSMLEDNTFYWGARPSKFDIAPRVAADFNPEVTLKETAEGIFLSFNIEDAALLSGCKQVNGPRLGITKTAEVPFETENKGLFVIDQDYFGVKRSSYICGPFATLKSGKNEIKVW